MTQKVKLAGKEEHHIDVTVLGKNIEVTTPLKNYVMGKVAQIEHLNHQGIRMTVRLDIQKLDHIVDIVLKFSHFKVQVHAITLEMYSTIDKAFDRLKSKLRKWKGKIQDHHAKGIPVVDLQVNVLEKHSNDIDLINDEIEEENYRTLEAQSSKPKVYKKKTRLLKTLNLDEAVMKMELSSDNFLIYRSEEDLKLKVLYRRKDDSYGVIALANEGEAK
jgi:putative sigma-54 modulation protein